MVLHCCSMYTSKRVPESSLIPRQGGGLHLLFLNIVPSSCGARQVRDETRFALYAGIGMCTHPTGGRESGPLWTIQDLDEGPGYITGEPQLG